MPEVSIVVPSRGGAQRLPRLLGALRGQTGCDWEVVIVLDGDVDGSEQVVGEHAAGLPVRVVVFPENRGRAAALNAGFDAARGEVLVRMDDDVEPRSDFAAQHAALHRGRRVGIVGPCEDVFPDTPYARAYGRPAEARVRADSYATPPEQGWRLWSGNVSVTREVYDEVGPYDTDFREYGWEDVDWGYRLHLLGVPVVAAPEVEALHHNPALSVSDRAARAFDSGRSRRRFELKHGTDALGVLTEPAALSSPWNAAVALTAAAAARGALPRLARSVDAALPRVPRGVGEKLAALMVEAAGRAGRHTRR